MTEFTLGHNAQSLTADEKAWSCENFEPGQFRRYRPRLFLTCSTFPSLQSGLEVHFRLNWGRKATPFFTGRLTSAAEPPWYLNLSSWGTFLGLSNAPLPLHSTAPTGLWALSLSGSCSQISLLLDSLCTELSLLNPHHYSRHCKGQGLKVLLGTSLLQLWTLGTIHGKNSCFL